MVEVVRISLGTAIQIGLDFGKKDPNFTTAFLMTYRDGGCEANCAFCPQAQESTSASDRLSRISWPEYRLRDVIKHWPSATAFSRICIQTICYPDVVNDVVEIVHEVRTISKLPISVAIHPIRTEEMLKLKQTGVSNIGIALDASTPALFEDIKGMKRGGAYRWESHIAGLQEALKIFGQGNVTTHLIVGLGETEKEAAEFICDMYEMGISVGLFAFTNIKGTALENHSPPNLSAYRRIQVVRHLVSKGLLSSSQIHETEDGSILLDIGREKIQEALSSGAAFQVTGCKGCNRPFYNERPRGPMFNYPRQLTEDELLQAINETNLVV